MPPAWNLPRIAIGLSLSRTGYAEDSETCCWVGLSIDVCHTSYFMLPTSYFVSSHRVRRGHGAHTPTPTSFHAGVRHRRGISLGLPSDDYVGGTNITCGGARSSSYAVSQPTHVSQTKSATYRLRGDCTAPLAPCNDVGWEPPRLRVLRVSQIKSDITPQPAAQNHASHGLPHACGDTKSEVRSRKYEGKPDITPQPAAQNHASHGVPHACGVYEVESMKSEA